MPVPGMTSASQSQLSRAIRFFPVVTVQLSVLGGPSPLSSECWACSKTADFAEHTESVSVGQTVGTGLT